MEHTRISQLPTPLNAQRAWEDYQALVMAADADRSLWGDFEHCKRMARAFDRWQTVSLASERAA